MQSLPTSQVGAYSTENTVSLHLGSNSCPPALSPLGQSWADFSALRRCAAASPAPWRCAQFSTFLPSRVQPPHGSVEVRAVRGRADPRLAPRAPAVQAARPPPAHHVRAEPFLESATTVGEQRLMCAEGKNPARRRSIQKRSKSGTVCESARIIDKSIAHA